MTNAWIEHVKGVAKNKGISYKEALKVAKLTYHHQPKKGGSLYTDWENQYFQEHGDEFASNVKQYGKYIPAPGPVGVAKKILTTFPRQLIRGKQIFNSLLNYEL